jgi:hypothetical protein
VRYGPGGFGSSGFTGPGGAFFTGPVLCPFAFQSSSAQNVAVS